MTAVTPPVTLEHFKQIARQARPLAVAVLEAQAFARAERARVDAYIAPVFAAFTFVDDEGDRIESPRDLYLCEDAELCATYYAACDEAHRAHGFTGPAGYCPALVAEHRAIQAEHALLEATAPAFGLEPCAIVLEHRRRWLELMIGAALKDR